MKLLHASMTTIALFLLQSCSSQPTQNKVTQTTANAEAEQAAIIHTSLKTGTQQPAINYPSTTKQQLSVPEAQIIRELYQSGCLIEEVEINRRIQLMRISCANDKPFSSSI